LHPFDAFRPLFLTTAERLAKMLTELLPLSRECWHRNPVVRKAVREVFEQRMAQYHDTAQQVIGDVAQSFNAFGTGTYPDRHTIDEVVAALPDGEGLEIEKICGPVHFDFYESNGGRGISRRELRDRFDATVENSVAVEKAFRRIGSCKPPPVGTATRRTFDPARE
jgi:hypothetical protein